MPRVTHRQLLVAVGVLAAVALVGMVALWPRGPAGAVDDGAVQTTELVDATLLAVDEVAGSSDDPTLLPGAELVTVTARLDDSGETVTFETSDETGDTYQPGQRVRLAVIEGADQTTYFVNDFRRGRSLLVLVALFLAAVIAFGRGQGVRALVGLALTFLVIVGFIVPAILADRSPVGVALVGSLAIMLVTVYLAHGASAKTTAAAIGTSIALLVTGLLALAFVAAASITGFASEEAVLANYTVGGLNLRGLLLAGIILGGLGVLDDVTVAQASTVFALRRANPQLRFAELVGRALAVGRDHIAATVNTLFLAYAGASLPLLILFATGTDPFGTIVTSEVVAVEVVRTLVGSLGLIAAVPLTTALAAALVVDDQAPPTPPAPAPPPLPSAADEDPAWEAQLRTRYGLPTRPGEQPRP